MNGSLWVIFYLKHVKWVGWVGSRSKCFLMHTTSLIISFKSIDYICNNTILVIILFNRIDYICNNTVLVIILNTLIIYKVKEKRNKI